ncbi:sigma-70 family RNA polymerase sigma factor [Paracoccus sp. KR1-242]|uniref:sigma-70 family RNA polymerase sigma factor n=1 Tax=Paracoccus sp. KR1-242 TaxID=3410028 RepID=UPI003C008768
MTTQELEDRLNTLRPRLHRYCARMTGSTVDGEDMVQDTLLKALRARAAGTQVDDLEPWLLRIAHNTCLDFLRRRSRHSTTPLVEDVADAPLPEGEIVSVGFHSFLRLPELQRCAVILKDVLGHSVDEVAVIAGCSPAAAKSALQRGRAALRKLAELPEDARLPLLPDAQRQKMAAYVALFQRGEFDTIRNMLAEDVRLELVNRLRLEGRQNVGLYFTRYAEATQWTFAFGAVDGHPAMLVFDKTGAMERPAHFVLIDWQDGRIAAIRDFLFAPYGIEAADWVRLD